ncbi:MAG TPA: class D sortase [Bryobacterales bacterium]|nr:class D sortase [Bryobacterales bacterium]
MRVKVRWLKSGRSRAQGLLRCASAAFFLLGLLAIGFCAAAYFHAEIYQAYAGWRFEKSLSLPPPPKEPSRTAARSDQQRILRFAAREGSVIGRIDIPRIGVSVMVVEGVQARNLKVAAGHIPGTALPGEEGNVGIAGHRDTFFRKLREVRASDVITLTTLYGSYQYSVESTRVVEPGDVQVLRPSSAAILTLVTCYPFYYVGSAPGRFIVRARQISGPAG